MHTRLEDGSTQGTASQRVHEPYGEINGEEVEREDGM